MGTKQEIVLVAGPPGGGKTSFVKSLVADGYCRINRDHVGGDLGVKSRCYSTLRMAYAAGDRSFVFDNVYATVESRAIIIEEAKKLGLPIRIMWLDTTPEQAQFFAARRQIQRYGRVLTKADYKTIGKTDENMFPPAATFAYWKKVVPPTIDEGFDAIDHVPVTVNLGPTYTNKALLLDYDGTLRLTKSGFMYPRTADDVVALHGRAQVLRNYLAQGYILCGVSNQSGLAKEDPNDEYYLTEANCRAAFDETNRQLGVDIDYMYAPERAGVPSTFFRKPMPGMAVHFIEKYLLDPAQCIVVGDMKTDETFAARAGMPFKWAHEFFGEDE
jgi:HAD superfamily hydrolase (TIGR01662 family)